jgi:hypothetical protein
MFDGEMQTSEDLIEIERAGRRCASCHTGRRWRRFEVVRVDGQDPVVMCPACQARFGAVASEPAAKPAAPAPTAPAPAKQPTRQPAKQPAKQPASQPVAAASPSEPEAATPEAEAAPGEDRLRRALRELPRGTHSVGRIAKAAGLNHERTLHRLQALEAEGEVQQVGKRWSSERPSTDVEAAFDRLQARTTNLRIIRDREPVG